MEVMCSTKGFNVQTSRYISQKDQPVSGDTYTDLLRPIVPCVVGRLRLNIPGGQVTS